MAYRIRVKPNHPTGQLFVKDGKTVHKFTREWKTVPNKIKGIEKYKKWLEIEKYNPQRHSQRAQQGEEQKDKE